MKKVESVLKKYKMFWYIATAMGAIVFTRIYVNFVHDPGPSLLGLELHHFDYALVTFIVTTLVQVFMKKASVLFLMVNAFSLGWLIDEIPYIRFNIVDMGLEYYNSSLFPVLMIFIIVPLTILFVAKREKAQRKNAEAVHPERNDNEKPVNLYKEVWKNIPVYSEERYEVQSIVN